MQTGDDQKDHIKTETTRHEISEIKTSVAEIKEKTHQLYFALMGNELTKDGGLIAMILKVEVDALHLSDKIQIIENREDRKNFYISVIWAFAGTIFGGILTALITYFLKK